MPWSAKSDGCLNLYSVFKAQKQFPSSVKFTEAGPLLMGDMKYFSGKNPGDVMSIELDHRFKKDMQASYKDASPAAPAAALAAMGVLMNDGKKSMGNLGDLIDTLYNFPA